MALRGGWRRRRGLEEVLIAQEHDDQQHGEQEGAAHVAAAATAAGARRLKIGIANFGQEIRPIRCSAPSGCRSFYVNGSWGKLGCCRAAVLVLGGNFGGTLSRPPRPNGLQRSSLQMANALPRTDPCVAIAMEAYSEHVGK